MRFLIRLIVITLVAIAVAIVGLLMLPGERIARVAETQLSKQLGREVSISPETSVSFYPILGVTTGPVSIANAEWSTNGPLLTSDSLAIGVDVPALIGGTIRITKLEAIGPHIILERSNDGRANWDLFEASSQTEQLDPVTEPTETTQSFDLSLDSAMISNANLRYIDPETGTDQNISDLDMELAWPSSGGPAVLALGATPFSERIALNTTVGNVLNLIGGKQTVLIGTLDAAGANLAIEGVASIKPEAALQITGTIPKAGALLRALGQDPKALGLAADFDPSAKIDSQVSFDGTRLALRKTALDLDDSTLSGDVDIVVALEQPQVTAKLQADVQNAGQMMQMFGQAPQKFGLAENFNPNLASAISLSIIGSDIIAKLTNLKASLEGADISGVADIKLKDAKPDVSATLAVDAPNVARLASTLGQPLSKFGLAADVDPSIKSKVSARLREGVTTANLSDLVATLAGARVSGVVDLDLSQALPAISGNIAANIPSTANLLRALGQSAADIPKGFGQTVTAKSKISLKSNQLNLSGLNMSLDQNTYSGSVAVDLAPSVPKVNAQLKAGDLDFSALNPEDTSESSSAGSGWSKDRIDASAVGLINGTIKLQARSIDLGKIKLGAADIGVAIDRARAVMSINNLNAYKGNFKGQLVANNRNGLSVAGDLNANSIALGPLLRALADIDRISSDGNLNLKFLGIGNSVDAIMRSLSGNLGLSMPQGNVSGVDIESLILQGDPSARLTQFEKLRATGVMNNGRLVSDDFNVSTKRVDAKGKGFIDLGAQTMNYLLTPIAKDLSSTGSTLGTIEIPVRIKGPWSNLSIRPDLEAALNLEAERKKLEERARQEIEREKQKLEDELKAKAQAEAKKLEDRARQKVEDAARRAAENAAKQLGLDKARQQQLEDAAKGALENELRNGLKNLLGGN